MKTAPALICALVSMTASAACSSNHGAPADGGSSADAPVDAPLGQDAAPGDSAAPGEFISARFGNFDTTLPAFDVCVRTAAGSAGITVNPTPLLAAAANLADGVPLDRVTARIALPFNRATANRTEMFLVRGDTIDCTMPTELLATGRAFGVFATTTGERNSFVALDPALSSLVRERETCPPAKTCVHFFNFTTRQDGEPGPELDVDVVDGTARTPLFRDIATGNDGPAEPPFVFDTNTGTVEIPVSGAGAVMLAVGETDAPAAFIQIELPDPAGQLFSLWIVGHPGDTGPSARRAILCRDFAPDADGFAACARHQQ